jgi:hypothetical protein
MVALEHPREVDRVRGALLDIGDARDLIAEPRRLLGQSGGAAPVVPERGVVDLGVELLQTRPFGVQVKGGPADRLLGP